jgi:hypothetical protein
VGDERITRNGRQNLFLGSERGTDVAGGSCVSDLRAVCPKAEKRVKAAPLFHRAQTSSPTARISASALLWVTMPGRIR